MRCDAAGAFAIQDNYKAIAAGGAASTLLPGGDNPLVAGLEGAGAIEASRQANAVAHGVSERMMVCVTDANIYVFALRSPMGNDPGDLLATFDRAGAEVEVKKFLGSKRLHIQEGEREDLPAGLDRPDLTRRRRRQERPRGTRLAASA